MKKKNFFFKKKENLLDHNILEREKSLIRWILRNKIICLKRRNWIRCWCWGRIDWWWRCWCRGRRRWRSHCILDREL